MKLEHLTQFAKLKEYNSLNKASENLYITHQALSKMISSLENEFATELILRSNSGITFTDDGIYLAQKAHEITALLDNTILQLKTNYLKKQSNDITLYIDNITHTHIIPKFLPYFHTHYPFIKFDIHIIENMSNDICCFNSQFESQYFNLLHTQECLGLFSYFGEVPPKLQLPPDFNHSLLSMDEVFIATKADQKLEDIDVFVLNERELGQHSAILNCLSDAHIIYVKSQRQCFLSLKDPYTATIAFKPNIYLNFFDVALFPVSPPLFLYTYIISANINSESTKMIQLFLKQLFQRQ